MSVETGYDQWAATYDEVANPTRDLEKEACETMLQYRVGGTALELGGGTGKNTGWLAERCERLVSADLSREMQAVARAKVTAANVEFRIGDVREKWQFGTGFDLITCSLILEHVEDLGHIFREAANALKPGGLFYICELHPFKQYAGSKARFEFEGKEKVLECYRHHVTDYTKAAAATGFAVEDISEWFGGGDRAELPRLIAFLFRNKG